MKNIDVFTATRMILLGLIALVFLSSCEQENANLQEQYNAEQQAKEKQASLVELKSCFTSNYLQAEDRNATKAAVASKLHGLCEEEFVHFRAVKFHYAPVPDIISPPPKMMDEELGLVEAFVEKSRAVMDRVFQRYHAPRERQLPPNHPPISPHIAPHSGPDEPLLEDKPGV